MRKLMQWAASSGDWQGSGFLGLPEIDAREPAMLQRWQVVVGGLALVLSRETRSSRNARYPDTLRLYQGLRRRLRQGKAIQVTPELLGDVMHEIASVADPMTTRCLRICFDASLARDLDGERGSGFESGTGQSTSRLDSQPQPPPTTQLRAA